MAFSVQCDDLLSEEVMRLAAHSISRRYAPPSFKRGLPGMLSKAQSASLLLKNDAEAERKLSFER